MAKLTFLGATETVTGSKYLLEVGGKRIMIDCGVFQGLKELRLRNWEPLPINPATIDYVLLTHAHIDHTGYLPRLVRDGFRGDVYCTETTKDLLGIMLPDSGKLQEEDARFANKHGFSKHRPALPLYTLEDAKESLQYIRGVDYRQEVQLTPEVKFYFQDAGHIMGSGMLEMFIEEEKTGYKVLFSGDLGRPNTPILQDPAIVSYADYILVESTYGDRIHPRVEPRDELAGVIDRVQKRGGILLIPSFAVGRTQQLVYDLWQLMTAGRIPQWPIYIDSPMAVSATKIMIKHPEIQDDKARELHVDDVDVLTEHGIYLVSDQKASMRLNQIKRNAIIISASGMATGGRIVHHLAQRLPDDRHTVLFVGYQAMGTRGRAMVEGKDEVKLHGRYIPINAIVEMISGYSAHADYEEILTWLKHFQHKPRKVFLVHGEPPAQKALEAKIKDELWWNVRIPKYMDSFELGHVE